MRIRRFLALVTLFLIYIGAAPSLTAANNDTFALPLITLQKFTEGEVDIKIDGQLDEGIWSTLPHYDNMRVIRPDTMAEVPFETRMQLFYTEKGLYVGVWAEQPKDTLVARLSSRDRRMSRDRISITLDPSGEGLYGYWFDVNLGGTLSDGTVLPERQFRSQWDGPWNGASAEHEEGYAVEFFLPWSMMSMPDVEGDRRKLGIYVARGMSQKGERWSWPALPQTQSRFMTALQPIEIDNFKPAKQFTFYPYGSTTYDVIESEDDYKAGFDVFWRPSSNLQLTATANPDFGNVESDDVVVNLTSFETFFPEKRPFFLEGQEIFATTPRATPRGFRGTPTMLVNTRRIGSPPISLGIDGLDLTDLEANQPSELVGAAKITGQNGQWRYGVLAAIEDDTKIEGTIDDIDVDLEQSGRDFGVARLLYETTDGGTRKGIGFISTLVGHDQGDAVVHGLDGHYLSDGGVWKVDGQLLYSDVDDESGTGGFVDVVYQPRQGMRHQFGFDYYDEDVDINDLGFLRRNDMIGMNYSMSMVESGLKHVKERETGVRFSQQYNSDGRVVRTGLFLTREYFFNNNNFLFTQISYRPSRWDDINSDGNGSFKIDHRKQGGFFFATDNSKPLGLGVGVFYQDGQFGGQSRALELELNWQPSDRFAASMFTVYEEQSDWLINWNAREFGSFESTMWRPRLALDFFLSAKQQFRISAQWVGIKAKEKKRLLVPFDEGSLILDGDPATGSRDFSISTLVFQARYRWEIAPLSDLFVVYTRGSDLPNMVDDSFSTLLRNSWTDRAVDVFVVKLRYRLGT